MAGLLPIPAAADGEKSGEFDYYVLALSWSPNWCALEGDAKASEQCEARHDFGWTLHGLWPQFHRGWPSYCPTVERAPSRGMTGDMADIMGTAGLAWYQWKKHGVCSGLSAAGYFRASRDAYAAITRPEIFRKLDKAVKIPASVVEEAFLQANPNLEADMITITCKDGHIQEARVCLSKELRPVPCGRDVIRDCRMTDAMFTPIR
ncbi:ribonuclease T2 [Marinovum sp. 2_MG-2023]|uniref:ribonuclease T2 n=1 Tax=Roseobacteraceae TaxID=2854170 RepID=UPI001FD62ECE|nr:MULTISPECIES: ribonuclease T2 [Roseobacteraceae]MCJ7872864.1 ribonuclease T2 [Phaeobacter sp. J2-8]MDO6730105.1 ribonuclease T2 [Marinovum sp. 2_MG-2023]MDO6779919.1 ribonuclease T2 [Marinovum sp. 1_MG-2023]